MTSWHEAFGGNINEGCCSLAGLLLLYHPPPRPSSPPARQQDARQSQSGGLMLGQCLDGQVRRRRYTSQGWEASCGQSTAFPLGTASRVLLHPSPETTQWGGLGEGASLDYTTAFLQRAGLRSAITTAQAMRPAWPPLATSYTGQQVLMNCRECFAWETNSAVTLCRIALSHKQKTINKTHNRSLFRPAGQSRRG